MSGELLRLRGISKRFYGVKVLDDVSFNLLPGEIHGLLGENGAGKSTLMKILDGALSPDEGEIVLEGVSVRFQSPRDAKAHGIAMVYQELNLFPHLSVAENIFVSSLPRTRWRSVDWKRLNVMAEEVLQGLGLEPSELDVGQRVGDLSVAKHQIVAVAKALTSNCKVLILDEPTSALAQRDVDNLFRVMKRLKAQGVAVVFISHRLREVLDVTDRITVLRNGRTVGVLETSCVSEDALVELIAGRAIKERYPKVSSEPSAPLLRLHHVNVEGKLHDISFELRKGEILGIVGLLGSGKTELGRAIFGVYSSDRTKVSGSIWLDGEALHVKSPEQAIDKGVGLVPEDRSNEGLLLNHSIQMNMSLPALKSLSRFGFVRSTRERAAAKHLIERLRIRCLSPLQLARNLSGGNQQKVALGKWLVNYPKLIILDEPTRGIDVGAKVEIYNLMNSMVSRGIGVLLLSSEVPEVYGMADRILVLNRGRIIRELRRGEVTEQELQGLVM